VVSTENETSRSPVTSLDLLMELQGEQQSFRFLVRALAALLATAAVIAVGSVIYFYFELQGLRSEYARQAQLNQVNLRIVAGEASRQRESTQAQLVAIREENEAARRQAELSRELQQAGSPGQIASYKDRAVSIARGHILGKTMNEVTSQVVAMVLRADQAGSVSLLTNGERVLMQAALDDWGGQVESATVRSEFQTLLDDSSSLTDQGVGAAGLAMLEYRKADGNSLGWNRGCSTVVDYVNQAAARGLNEPMLLLWKGQCLRKRGDALLAYEAFSQAAKLMEADPEDITLEQSQMAHHGVGTTLIALAAQSQLPEGQDKNVALQEALSELRTAAKIRADRGSTRVGVAYTEENMGFIYILEEDWPAALSHTENIDNILPLAWNLTVRNIARAKMSAALKRGGASREAVEEMRRIQNDTAMVLSLMDCGQIDKAELMRLLPQTYSDEVDELAAHCLVESGGI
jgi:tetratricopeptide (TPR) repeat protein